MFAIEIRAYDGTWYQIARDGRVKTFSRKGDAMLWAMGDAYERGALRPRPKPNAWRIVAV